MTGGGSNTESREERAMIVNRYGLHARPAAELVKLAGTFSSEILVRKGDLEVNGKSIMGVLMLAAERGTELVIKAQGADAADAADALRSLIERGFGER